MDAVAGAGCCAVGGDAAAGLGSDGASSNANGDADEFGDVSELSDDELVSRMLRSRSDGEIRSLLDGDLNMHGGDHSAADMALCSHLAFWCAGDEGRMDRMFRASGLMRGKWDSRRGGTTYGAQTIQRAVANAGELYRPKRAGRAAAAVRGGAGGGSHAAAGALNKRQAASCASPQSNGSQGVLNRTANV